MPELQLKTPVAFLIFNRPDTTDRVFAEIAKAKPPKLLVVADGPRKNKQGEIEKCQQTRDIIKKINWDCEVLTNFSDENLGCKNRIASGLDWVFENVPEAIILEDDCLPSQEFFIFCEKMLAKYSNNKRIGMVSGFNPLGSNVLSNEYFTTMYTSIWGWATWKDRWELYDKEMIKWKDKNVKKKILKNYNYKSRLYFKLSFNLTEKKILNTWDYQWTFCNMYFQMKTIKPVSNLISNIGVQGTHASRRDKNHFIQHGKQNFEVYIRNDNISTIQDLKLLKLNYPNIYLLILKNILYELNLYKIIKYLKKKF